MSDKFGTGVGRHLNGNQRQYSSVIFQVEKPPISEEFNLMEDVMEEARKNILKSQQPSGWVLDMASPKGDFECQDRASNMFWLGRSSVSSVNNLPTAIVNGWVIPVAGTASSDLRNAIKLPPPQDASSSTQINFVFLEVWQSSVSPDGPLNKPSQDQIYRFGNVEFGGVNLSNQIQDPRYAIETSERIQLQYRIRVVDSVNPEGSPYGFNVSVRGQGPLSSPISTSNSAYQYENMGDEMGDAGLWRAGVAHDISENGINILTQSQYDTVDGFVYAIPLCFVFRRSAEAWDVSQQMSALNRTPLITDRSQATVLADVRLAQEVSPTEMSFVTDVSQDTTTFPVNSGRISIGAEIIEYSSWTGTSMTVTSRGAQGTHPLTHKIDAQVSFVTGHPLGLFADQITLDDIYDLRHGINVQDLDHASTLHQNFLKLATGSLQSQWKMSSGDMIGTRHFQADYFSRGNAPSNYALERDAPDGFRKIFSDACTLQPGNLVVIPQDSASVSSANYTFNLSSTEVYRTNILPSNWIEGDNIRISLLPLRATFKTADNQKVRFVHPHEYEGTDHDPVSVTFGTRSSRKFADANLNSGVDRDLVVLGRAPTELNLLYQAGISSDLTFDGDSITITAASPSVVDFSNPTGFSTDSIVQYLVDTGAYIVIEDASHALPYRGAFRIVGQNLGATGLRLEDAHGNPASFGATSTRTCDWRIRYEECTESDEDVIIVLANQSYPEKALYLSFDVIYHSNQGLSRVPEIPLYTQMEPGGSTAYVRPNTFPNVASSVVENVKKFSNVPLQAYPLDRTQPRFRTNSSSTSIEDTWAESYVDPGSKTLLFQPCRRGSIYVNADVINETEDSVASYASPGTSTGLDFQLSDGSPCIFFPSEALPPVGRMDLPVIKETGAELPSGINFVIPSMISGSRVNTNLTQNRVVALYDAINTNLPSDYNTYVNLSSVSTGGPSENALVCRLYNEGGVRGLELPAHFGVSRLFGVYLREDYYINGSEYSAGSAYRVRKPSYSGKNLLRLDVSKRNLILTGNNTFVVPEDVLDLDGLSQDLSLSELVFEFSAFMFNDWTQDKVQIHTINGSATSDGILPILLNGACASVDSFYNVSTRIPYQGNISGTMPSSTSDTSSLSFPDYTLKVQADRKSNLLNVESTLDPREARVENPAQVEILSALPFLTSIGTGSISGQHKVGTYTDVGYLSQRGFPFNLPSEVREAKVRGLEGHDKGINSGILSGMTERLPVGILCNDHMFLGEKFGNDAANFKTHAPLTQECGYMDFRGDVALSKPFGYGSVHFSDGTSGGSSGSLSYQGTPNLFRTYRGGVVQSASGNNPGGAVAFGTGTLTKTHPALKSFALAYAQLTEENRQGGSSSVQLTQGIEALVRKHQRLFQVHGGVLFGVALLVRTRKEFATSNETVVNHGGELQMLIITGADFGTDLEINPMTSEICKESLQPSIQLQFTGLGEGRCAADRYRIPGRPLVKTSRRSNEEEISLNRGSNPAQPVKPICP